MNKIKEELRLKMLGQLSDENTTVDVDNAYGVVLENAVLFSLFCAKNCQYQGVGWWNRNWRDEALTTEELFKIWENTL